MNFMWHQKLKAGMIIMNLEKEMAIIEAILFMESEPVDLKTLCRISGISKDGVEQVLSQIREHYSQECHGLQLSELDEAYHLLPKKELWDQLRDRYGKRQDGKLSKAAMETLSIVAYSQPVTRGEIDNIRGVASDGMLRLLVQRGLVQEVGKKDAPGRPTQFGTTKDFLKVFRINSLSELPKLDELEKQRFELN